MDFQEQLKEAEDTLRALGGGRLLSIFVKIVVFFFVAACFRGSVTFIAAVGKCILCIERGLCH